MAKVTVRHAGRQNKAVIGDAHFVAISVSNTHAILILVDARLVEVPCDGEGDATSLILRFGKT